MEILCAIKSYDWGQLGHNSLVAQLGEKNNPSFIVNEETPYAELWMGTHINGPSIVKKHGLELKEYIERNPSCLGHFALPNKELSFLFKVLSVRKALSIQVHPNKEEARDLHKMFPKLYTDENHKPELAVAITHFEALCGFRPLEEISDFMKNIPELCQLVDPDELHKFIERPSVALLETCFSSYITASPVTAKKCAAKLIERFADADCKIRDSQLAELFNKLNKQFPGDIGLFAIYFFNYVTLKPGEGIFLDAGYPHAYIFGDCVEVMACSDNVVRAGLTPKTRDVATLLKIIKYIPIHPEDIRFQHRFFDKYISVFEPPVTDFGLSKICIPKEITYKLPSLRGASILLVIKGSADCALFEIKPGAVVFIPSEFVVDLTVRKDLEMYRAFSNV